VTGRRSSSRSPLVAPCLWSTHHTQNTRHKTQNTQQTTQCWIGGVDKARCSGHCVHLRVCWRDAYWSVSREHSTPLSTSALSCLCGQARVGHHPILYRGSRAARRLAIYLYAGWVPICCSEAAVSPSDEMCSGMLAVLIASFLWLIVATLM
jgi:hypothetical protein